MAKARIISSRKSSYLHEKEMYVFLVALAGEYRKYSFGVKSFEGKKLEVEPLGGSIDSFAQIFEDCFKEESNFAAELERVYGKSDFNTIKFIFNEISVCVTRENANKDAIIEQWENNWRKRAISLKWKENAWFQTPEGQRYLAELKKQEEIRNKVINAYDKSEMEFKTDEAKKLWKALDSSDLGVVFARLWAQYMQRLLRGGHALNEIAVKSFNTCNDTFNISNEDFLTAIDLLLKYWKYGDELDEIINADK